jgi:ABC-type multidrug transport system ATPase subunit
MLELIDVSVWRGANRIVDALHLKIIAGRVFWVMGPNGAGKSSLLRVMAGIEPPRRGSLRRAHRPGEPFLYFHSEMALPGTATVGDWERLVARLMPPGCPGERTPLWPEVDSGRRAARLSTGERKRLLLDALLRRPGSLLLDEPFEHLSPGAKSELARLLEVRARSAVVVVATNQATEQASRGGGLRLEGGTAAALTSGDRRFAP